MPPRKLSGRIIVFSTGGSEIIVQFLHEKDPEPSHIFCNMNYESKSINKIYKMSSRKYRISPHDFEKLGNNYFGHTNYDV